MKSFGSRMRRIREKTAGSCAFTHISFGAVNPVNGGAPASSPIQVWAANEDASAEGAETNTTNESKDGEPNANDANSNAESTSAADGAEAHNESMTLAASESAGRSKTHQVPRYPLCSRTVVQ